MPLTAEIQRMIAEANVHEDAGRHKKAEAAYLDAIRRLGAGDEELVGMISINLGSNAVDDGRLNDAVGYYTQAIRLLDGRKGEAMLQCAHAHYNLARLQYQSDAGRDALVHAEKALALYERYPFTMSVDIADARILHVVARALAREPLEQQTIFEAWEAARAVPFQALNTRVAADFLGIYVPVVRHHQPDSFHARVSEIASWAGPTLAHQLSAYAEGGRP